MKRQFLFTFLVSVAVAASSHAQVVVIANPSVKATEITKSDLHDIFTGAATTIKGGGVVVPILLNGGTANEEFLKAYIGKSDSAYRASWRSLVFSGQATMPKSLEDDKAVVAFVESHSGAIGYIDKAVPHGSAKTLAIK